MELRVKAEGLERAAMFLQNIPGALQKAQRLAEQKAVNAMRAAGVREASSLYYMKAGEIRSAASVVRRGGHMMLYSRGRPRTLRAYYLSPNTRGPKQERLKGAVRRDRGIKSLGSAFLFRPHGVFLPAVRKGKKRYPLKVLTGPSIPQLLENKTVMKAMTKRGQEVFTRELERQTMRMLGVIR